jgi:hypothetical protein
MIGKLVEFSRQNPFFETNGLKNGAIILIVFHLFYTPDIVRFMSMEKSKRCSISIPNTQYFEKENAKSANPHISRPILMNSQSQLLFEDKDPKSKRRSIAISPSQLPKLQQLFQLKDTSTKMIEKKKKTFKNDAQKTKKSDKPRKQKDKNRRWYFKIMGPSFAIIINSKTRSRYSVFY